MSDDSPKNNSRRGFLQAVSALVVGAGAVLFALPVLRYLGAPLRRKQGGTAGFLPIAAMADLDTELPTAVPVVGERVDAWTRAAAQRLGTVWLRKKSDGRVLALQAECPHLGCSIRLDAEHKRFACPCHESYFDLEGRCTTGPSPRGMDPLNARVQDGKVEVQFVRFRTQSRDREKLG